MISSEKGKQRLTSNGSFRLALLSRLTFEITMNFTTTHADKSNEAQDLLFNFNLSL